MGMPPSTHRLPRFVPGRLTEMSNPQSSSIAQRFEKLKQDGRLALMPFLMAGDPDLAVTARSGSPAIRNGIKARRPSCFSCSKRWAMEEDCGLGISVNRPGTNLGSL